MSIFIPLMKNFICIIAAVLTAIVAYGQREYPFYAEKDISGWDVTKKDSFGTYRQVPDQDRIVYFSPKKKQYKLLDGSYKLLEQGQVENAGETYWRTGAWTTYYDNGKIKSVGRYYQGLPAGLWKWYYPGGQLKSIYSYGIVRINKEKYGDVVGTYQEYYESGQLKVDGLYNIVFDTAIRDAVAITDPETSEVKVKESQGEIPHMIQAGTWYYYKENGELMKEENFQ